MKRKNYVAYLRQSTMKQEISGLGVEAQREIIRNYLKDRKTVAEYIETESGRKSDRPKLAEALELCRKTNSVLIVAKLDRLSRMWPSPANCWRVMSRSYFVIFRRPINLYYISSVV